MTSCATVGVSRSRLTYAFNWIIIIIIIIIAIIIYITTFLDRPWHILNSGRSGVE